MKIGKFTPAPSLNLQDLPSEILIDIVRRLPVYEQACIAPTSKRLRDVSDMALMLRVPESRRTLRGGRVDFGEAFSALPNDTRAVLRRSDEALPCPDIFALSASMLQLHAHVAHAAALADRGIVSYDYDSMVNALYAAKKLATHENLPVPYTSTIEIRGYTNAVALQLARARDAARCGRTSGPHAMYNCLYRARQNALKAGITMPDTSEIEALGRARAPFQSAASGTFLPRCRSGNSISIRGVDVNPVHPVMAYRFAGPNFAELRTPRFARLVSLAPALDTDEDVPLPQNAPSTAPTIEPMD